MDGNLSALISQTGVTTSGQPSPGEPGSAVSGQPGAAPNATFPAGLDLGQTGVTTQTPAAQVPQIDPGVVRQLLADNQAMRSTLQETNRRAQEAEERMFQAQIQDLDPEDRYKALFERQQRQAQAREQELQNQLQSVQGNVRDALEQAAKVQIAHRVAEQYGLGQDKIQLLLVSQDPVGMQTLAASLAQMTPAQQAQVQNQVAGQANVFSQIGNNPGSTPPPEVKKRSGDLQGYIASRSYQYGSSD